MIDYVKIAFSNIDIEHLLLNPCLDFKTELSEQTGELGTRQVAIHHFCKTSIYDTGTVLFSGSIHKLYNSINGIKAPNCNAQKKYKGYNGNLFTLNNIIEVREYIQALFNCTPQQMQFRNIEFGVNTEPNFYPNLFLKGLLYHNGKIFEYKYNGSFTQSVHQHFIFKIYNKSEQYGMSTETLRIELKYLKMTEVKSIGIITFADINENTLKKANELLLKRFKEINYYDYTINKKGLTKRQKQTVKNYSNPRYWFEEITVKKRHVHKNKLKEFIVNNSDNLHQQLTQEIELKGGIITRQTETPKRGIITHSNIGILIPPKPPPTQHQNQQQKKDNKCLVTGKDISMQKDDSLLLSHTGLQYYFKNDIDVFNTIKKRYLTNKWMQSEHLTQIKEIAHNIRNTKYNQDTKQIQLYPYEQLRLFNF